MDWRKFRNVGVLVMMLVMTMTSVVVAAPGGPRTVTVREGDSLYGIAEENLGDGELWPLLNGGSTLVRPGDALTLPANAPERIDVFLESDVEVILEAGKMPGFYLLHRDLGRYFIVTRFNEVAFENKLGWIAANLPFGLVHRNSSRLLDSTVTQVVVPTGMVWDAANETLTARQCAYPNDSTEGILVAGWERKSYQLTQFPLNEDIEDDPRYERETHWLQAMIRTCYFDSRTMRTYSWLVVPRYYPQGHSLYLDLLSLNVYQLSVSGMPPTYNTIMADLPEDGPNADWRENEPVNMAGTFWHNVLHTPNASPWQVAEPVHEGFSVVRDDGAVRYFKERGYVFQTADSFVPNDPAFAEQLRGKDLWVRRIDAESVAITDLQPKPVTNENRVEPAAIAVTSPEVEEIAPGKIEASIEPPVQPTPAVPTPMPTSTNTPTPRLERPWYAFIGDAWAIMTSSPSIENVGDWVVTWMAAILLLAVALIIFLILLGQILYIVSWLWWGWGNVRVIVHRHGEEKTIFVPAVRVSLNDFLVEGLWPSLGIVPNGSAVRVTKVFYDGKLVFENHRFFIVRARHEIEFTIIEEPYRAPVVELQVQRSFMGDVSTCWIPIGDRQMTPIELLKDHATQLGIEPLRVHDWVVDAQLNGWYLTCLYQRVLKIGDVLFVRLVEPPEEAEASEVRAPRARKPKPSKKHTVTVTAYAYDDEGTYLFTTSNSLPCGAKDSVVDVMWRNASDLDLPRTTPGYALRHLLYVEVDGVEMRDLYAACAEDAHEIELWVSTCPHFFNWAETPERMKSRQRPYRGRGNGITGGGF